MPTRDSRRLLARLRARTLLQDLGAELREARLTQDRTLREVAGEAGISRSQLSRVELGESPAVSISVVSMLCRVLDMDFSARVYPGRRRLRDGPQLRLLDALRIRLGSAWSWRFEVQVAPGGDRRAWDARAIHGSTGTVVVIEAETRIRDAQALLRRVGLKQAAAGAPRLVLLVAGTRHNREALREAGEYLRSSFPIGTREALRALGHGTDPGGDCLIVISPAVPKR